MLCYPSHSTYMHRRFLDCIPSPLSLSHPFSHSILLGSPCSANLAPLPSPVSFSYRHLTSPHTPPPSLTQHHCPHSSAPSGLFSLHWKRVALDEAHTIKNADTEAAKACYMVNCHIIDCYMVDRLHSMLQGAY